ncbi:MAG: putative component of type VI protein secretion system [Rhodothermales bacterium]|jgi:predicted component of type VI protein secretion system
MSRKSQQILIVTAILMTVAVLMVFVGGMGVGEPETDSVEIYLNEIDTLVTDKPADEDANNRLDNLAERAERLDQNRAEPESAVVAPPDPKPTVAAKPAKGEAREKAIAAKQEANRQAALARQDAERKAAAKEEELLAVIDDTVIDDTEEAAKAQKKEKKEGKPSKMKEVVKSYAKRMKPLLEARGMDLSDLEGMSPGDQLKAVGKKLIEALRANGGSVFGA